MNYKKLLAIILLISFYGLSAEAQKGHKFIRVGESLGIDSNNPGNVSPEASLGHAVAWGDINDDGMIDVAFSNQGGEVNGMQFWLYQNTEAGFIDISETSGLGELYADKIIFADLNGDYFPEIIAYKQAMQFYPFDPAEQTIYRNNGDLTFTKMSSTGVNQNYKVQSVADFDKDGFVDLLTWDNTGAVLIYENNGDFTFTASIIVPFISDLYAISCIDYNNDTYPDFYTSTYGANPNYLFKNNGDGTFTDVTTEAGVAYADAGHGLTVGDMNNDGYQDIYVGGYNQNISSKLFKNNGNGTFSDITLASGTSGYTDTRTSSFVDYNNDSFLDIFSSHHQFWVDQNILYHNVQNETFFDVSVPLRLSYETADEAWLGDYFGTAWGDFNNDGDMDLFAVGHIQEDHYSLWKNSENPKNSIILNLKGVASNKSAIGAKAVLTSGENVIYRTVNPIQGQRDGHSMRLHFGLDTDTEFDNITVYWPSGLEQTIDFAEFTINAVNTVVEDEGVTEVFEEIIYDIVTATDIDNDNNINVFPNPSNGLITVDSKKIKLESIEIVDITGKIVYSQNIDSEYTTIDLSNKENGLYIIKFISDNKTYSKRIMIIK